MSPKARVLIYVLRRDLRLADNPIFNEVSRLFQQSQHPFTHFLPVFTFPANQVEVSGFISDSSSKKSPYPEARAPVSGFWRCGKLRAKFLAESVWDLKKDLERVGSDLQVRVGTVHDAVQSILQGYKENNQLDIAGVWMTNEEGVEEKREEKDVRKLCKEFDAEFKLWQDEKYFVDDRDIPLDDPRKLSDVFTAYRKTVEPLRSAPRKTIPAPSTLPPLPEYVPAQSEPFEVPDSLEGIMSALTKPLGDDMGIPHMPSWPKGAESAHPYVGGSKSGHERIDHLIESGSMSAYKDTRNGLLGQDFSTKLSAWLALGCCTAREIHWKLIDFEDGKTPLGKGAPGYGKGENKGTAAVRFELLWRDYMRLCTRKFGPRLFRVEGFRNDQNASWKYISSPFSDSTDKKNKGGSNDDAIAAAVLRFVTGRTGTGLIDASQRELFLTGYTSNRARQNVASYLSKHLGVDWRIGAEWYECNLIDYDLSSNWGNWQYVAGVGNDPRGESRVFNPIKQALDYDSQGDYIRTWVEELKDVKVGSQNDGTQDPQNLMGVFQAWKLPEEEKKRLDIQSVEWVQKPLVKIDFSLNRRGGGSKRGRGNGRGGRGGGGRGGKSERKSTPEKAHA